MNIYKLFLVLSLGAINIYGSDLEESSTEDTIEITISDDESEYEYAKINKITCGEFVVEFDVKNKEICVKSKDFSTTFSWYLKTGLTDGSFMYIPYEKYGEIWFFNKLIKRFDFPKK